MTFALPELDFKADALEPFMDQQTVEIHHGKHHAGYTAKMNAALEEAGLTEVNLETEVFPQVSNMPKAIAINAGQYWNHSFFWKSLAPTGQEASEKVSQALTASFGGYDGFVSEFTKAASSVFGSGWAWLCQRQDGSLTIVETFNHENPLMENIAAEHGQVTPLLVIDVWEHAYYLKYQNRRPEFIEAFLQIVDWEEVERRMS